MEFSRVHDYELVRLILTVEGVYGGIGDDHSPPAEEFEPNRHPDIWYVIARSLRGLIGLFMLIPKSQVNWELHAAMLPWATTRDKWDAARGLPAWLAEHTGCRHLTAEVPVSNRRAIVFGTHGLGMRFVGRHTAAFLKNGCLQDVTVLERSVGS